MDLWEDREILFDFPSSQMKMRPGEEIIDRLDYIEDTKGNGGDKGRLLITNLRIIWHSLSSPKIRLTIGFNCIINASTKIVNSKLRGTTEALHILTKYNNSRYEFIFTNLVPGNMRHFTSVMGVHKAFLSSKIYRELKLRGAVVKDKQLKILPLENIYTTVDGVWNLSSDQGNLGSFIITNIRLVWFADMNETFNISLPHIQIASVKIRESRFGPALVIESSTQSGGYVLGFRLDPPTKLHSVARELSSLHAIHSEKPEFGVQFVMTSHAPMVEVEPILPEEVEELDDSARDVSTTLSAYYADHREGEERPPVYCPELGLAIESLKEGFTLASLWQVIPPPTNPSTLSS
uniref:BBSome complex member BBS5 PH domain-containing protein n=2 Tax=Clastoptera arizonana TaxID=38151 RepID=A0A1B6DL88_9HEMI